MRRAALFAFASSALVLAACSGGPTLSVVVRTDFAPTTEFVTAQVTVDGTTRVHAVGSGDDWFAGVHLADYDVAVGSHDVHVTLVDASARVVAHREVVLTLTGSYTLVVELTRSCAMRTCPGTGDPSNATECLGSRCVDPHCGGTDTAACPPNECAVDGDCPAPVSTCAGATCDHGLCLYQAHDDRCSAPTPICDLALGCVAMVTPADGGAGDLGVGVDASTGDAGVTDLGATDLGPADLGTDAATMCFSSFECRNANPCANTNCAGGVCVGGPVPDGNGCSLPPTMLICSGFGSPRCMSGVCTVPGGTPCPDDGNPCTRERCGGGGGICRHDPVSGNACTDDAGCPSTCNLGVCPATGC